jgi:hypothetical protein
VSPVYVVILHATLHGSSVMATEDVVEAYSPEQAEEQAIAAWRALEPRFNFSPLLVLQRQ